MTGSTSTLLDIRARLEELRLHVGSLTFVEHQQQLRGIALRIDELYDTDEPWAAAWLDDELHAGRVLASMYSIERYTRVGASRRETLSLQEGLGQRYINWLRTAEDRLASYFTTERSHTSVAGWRTQLEPFRTILV